MKKITSSIIAILLAGSLLLTAGCASQSTAVSKTSAAIAAVAADPFGVQVKLTNQKEDNILIQTAIPEFSGFSSADELNSKISQLSKDGIARLKEDTKDLGDSAGAGSLYYSSFFDYSRNNDVLSVWITSGNYSGGAHGMSWINSFTVNTKTGTFYTDLGSLFQEPAAGEKKITDRILKTIDEKKDAYFPEAPQAVKDRKNKYSFYLDGGNLIVYFDLYELIPYAGGIPKFEFPVKDLALKPMLGNQKSLGITRLNGTDTAFTNPVYTENDNIYLPLEETATHMGHKVTNSNGKYTVDGKAAEVKAVGGKVYVPLIYFTETLNDFVIYDGTALRLFPKTKAAGGSSESVSVSSANP